MKVRQAIELARGLKQIDQANYPDILMLQFLNECEGKLQTEFLHIADVDCQRYTEDDMDMDLIVGPPHDKLYYAYLCAMIDFTNGEYAKYNNSIIVANAFMAEWAAWFNRTHERDGRQYLGVFLSAYGIAVKHGYAGTEEEWLASLRGPEGPAGETGPQGPQGVPGTVSFEELTPEQVTMLKGEKGDKGETGTAGKSAYTAAQEGGYTGAEAEFNAALASAPGHIVDTAIHVTAEEKTAWNAKQNALTGTQGQVVGFGADGKPVAQDAPSSIPAGGTTGQVLAKKSETDYDTEWKDASAGDLPVSVEILETICENIELTNYSPIYTFPAAITLDENGLYYLYHKYYDASGNLVPDYCGGEFSRPVSGDDGLSVTWLDTNSAPVTLTSTGITDAFRRHGLKSVITIVKVSSTITDKLKFDAVNLEGFNTTASGMLSHAEGYSTTASGTGSHAEGYATIARGEHSHAQGKFNIEDTEGKYAHIVGNGSSDSARSNAHTLDWDGNAWFAGTVEGSGSVLRSTTEGSAKKFTATVDDTGEISLVDEEGNKVERNSAGLTVTNTAAVGQTVKITAVDENSQPTEWEAVDMESGGAWHTIGKQTMDGVETAVSFDANGETIVQIVVAGTTETLNATKATVSLTHQSGKTFDFYERALNSTIYFPKNVFLIVGETKCRQMIFVSSELSNYNGKASFAVEGGYSGDKNQYTERDPITKITITFDVAPVSGAVVRMEGM